MQNFISWETMNAILIASIIIAFIGTFIWGTFKSTLQDDNKINKADSIFIKFILLMFVFMIITNFMVYKTESAFCEISSIVAIQDESGNQYLLKTTDGAEYLVDIEDVIISPKIGETTEAEIKTYKLLSKDGTQIIESVNLYIEITTNE